MHDSCKRLESNQVTTVNVHNLRSLRPSQFRVQNFKTSGSLTVSVSVDVTSTQGIDLPGFWQATAISRRKQPAESSSALNCSHVILLSLRRALNDVSVRDVTRLLCRPSLTSPSIPFKSASPSKVMGWQLSHIFRGEAGKLKGVWGLY